MSSLPPLRIVAHPPIKSNSGIMSGTTERSIALFISAPCCSLFEYTMTIRPIVYGVSESKLSNEFVINPRLQTVSVGLPEGERRRELDFSPKISCKFIP